MMTRRMDLRSPTMRDDDEEAARQAAPRPITYLLGPAPAGQLRFQRSGPYGYFPLEYFRTWQEWCEWRDLNAHLFAAPNALVGEQHLPPGWAGKPEPEDVNA
jgi:hypothetical protein